MELKFNLFRNDKKGNDKAPDYRGNTQDKAYDVACWLKDDKNGNKYLSCVLKDAQQKQPSAPNSGNNQAPNNGNVIGSPQNVDDLPF